MEKLQPGSTYPIFNHANGFENVFCDDGNYWFFLDQYKKHIFPIAETFAWCLMPNHFHLVVRIRKREIIEELIRNKSDINFSKVPNFGKVKNYNFDNEIEKFLSKQFANLFSSYTQAFNKMHHRKGSMFIKNFKRELITCKEHFLITLVYVHRNPIHHGFRTAFDDWPYSSYLGILNTEDTGVENKKVLAVFGGRDAFIKRHAIALHTLNSGFIELT